MPLADVNHQQLYYQQYGEGPTLLLIAGFSADHTVWREIIKPLSENYHIITTDNRAAGRSSVPDTPFTVADMAQDHLCLLDHLNIHQAHVLGSSMGGMIALEMAHHAAEKVQSLILSNTTQHRSTVFSYFTDTQAALIKQNTPPALLSKASLCWLFSYTFLSRFKSLDELVRLSLANPHPFSPQGFDLQNQALHQYDARPWINTIQQPSLVLGGEQDIIYMPHMTQALANALPNSTMHIFDACAHLPFLEQPQHFVRIVSNFLAQQ